MTLQQSLILYVQHLLWSIPLTNARLSMHINLVVGKHNLFSIYCSFTCIERCSQYMLVRVNADDVQETLVSTCTSLC